MKSGSSGVLDTDTFIVRALLVQHELLAATETVPPIAPAVAAIDVEEELPLHPDGKDQLYEVAPETADIL